MKIIAFIEQLKAIDKIIRHLKLSFQPSVLPHPCGPSGASYGSRGVEGLFLRVTGSGCEGR